MSQIPVSLEPSAAVLAHHPARWWLATRPAFLSITLAGVLLGLAGSGWPAVQQNWLLALLGLLLALLTHAAVNVINDVADHHNGTDAANTARLFPFTGGSRFIQNGVLSARQMQGLAYGLFGLVVLGGLYLVSLRGLPLLLIGLVGVVLGWGYSAPPLRLNSRGFGELSVLLCFLLLPQGMAVLLAGQWQQPLLWASLPFAILTSLLLYINQFPDRTADRLAGKWHWVARLPLEQARSVYGVLVLLAYALLIWLVWRALLPRSALLGLLSLPLSLFAARQLWRHAAEPARLRPAIIATIMAANLFPLLLALALLLG
ncbi:prenyltransferase [Aquitalea sp. FJL05]|uniref:prenyltransferase n=1 Tax=Aquitalea TaxID=407217 RepID=UPI000F5B608E|nr:MULTISPECIES: prenyltransferase [Aquitalea]RQO66921.1 prenyltransferase [Aquitalea sp. FJL05]